MKKFLPYILILTIIVQLFAPFSVGVGMKNNIEVQSNITKAEEAFYSYLISNDEILIEVTKFSTLVECEKSKIDWLANEELNKTGNILAGCDIRTATQIESIEKAIREAANNTIVYSYIVTHTVNSITGQKLEQIGPTNNFSTMTACEESRNARVLTEEQNKTGNTVSACKESTIAQTTKIDALVASEASTDGLPLCVFKNPVQGTFPGCMAQMFYYVFFVPTSYVFALAGTFFDFTFHYSVQDESYRTPFVVEGWGIVRDFCNMFFIFVLLYIAFGTILNLHSVKTKEMIINVIIIGLLINFSLFATQVIIDASNILARVFYNSDSIKITQGNTSANGVASATPGLKIGPNGEIPLSAAIVNKVNPQNLIINGRDAVIIKDKVSNTQTTASNDKQGNLGTGAFILITLLAVAVNVVGIIVFLSVGLIFVTRVIGLWFAMIFSPFVFFSYTVPSLQDMEMVGWKKWWPETLKLAFLAPIFIFFIYLIIAFLEKGLSLVKANDVNDGMTFVISVIVPFIFIMVLLMKAKDIAKTMSGKMGEMAVKAGSAIGGVALGAGIGAGAMAMRGTVGRLGNKLATSSFAKSNGAIGRGFGNLGKWAGSSSFDARATKLGSMAGKELGVDMGKAKEGGYAKHLSEKVEKRQKRAKELEVGENEDLKQDLNKVEMEHQGLLREYSHEIETLDKRIKTARENAADINSKETTDPAKVAAKKAALVTASAMSTATPDEVAKKTAAIAAANAMDTEDPIKVALKKEANDRVAELKEYKKAIKDGKSSFAVTSLTDSTVAPGMSKTIHFTDTGTATGIQKNITSSGKSINQLEDFEIPHAHSAIEKENRNRKWAYAEEKSKWGGRANKEAAHKIRMEAKMGSGDKSH